MTSTGRLWFAEEGEDWAVIQGRRAQQLPGFLRQLRDRSALYADRLSGRDPAAAGSLEGLAGLPFTTKDDLRDGQAEPAEDQVLGLQQAVPTSAIEQVISSSGTTGNPVYFGLTRRDRETWTEAIGAFYATAGIGPGSVAGLSTGMPIVAGGVPYADGIRNAGGALVWFGGQTTPRMVTTIERLRVNTLVATASFVTMFAEKIEEVLGHPARELGVRTIISGGEPGMGLPDVRAAVMEKWGAERISEVMGLGDVMPGLWAECEAGTGMHFTAVRDVLVELIDPATGDQLPWETGAEGELVYTTIRREATPVLRFRSRDHVVITGMECSCGRKTPKIRCIGRTDDMLIYKAMNVFPTALREVALGAAPGEVHEVVKVRKESADQVRFDEAIPLQVQPLGPLDEAQESSLRQRIEAAVRERLRVRVAVELVEPGTFTITGDKNSLVTTGPPVAPRPGAQVHADERRTTRSGS
ncbi:phenylacetate-CoA ligase/benzoylacetate-CoA ligase [Quadrisphaera granulorum]|uniref:Phenylacetate-CoA ligase/benzoylacetate-CoA ligase n=1 Tax=Quadrisphaera granulorum TaxID=317664 RepID=A0A316A9R1_9ACTN|nr:phenylacetate--CoA ligase family protein [Quadrisphaera granulorum]PWJ54383.1 phenylacetate-CoA ligase/benzoylacetate-CoA ligase [Quadrisphaera granulorum]SZE96155.1 phenylacetate-CoA ligase/benzoylacetate-CoA ligase [Quadrisphaera granulorum]